MSRRRASRFSTEGPARDVRQLVVILGDQLDHRSALLERIDPDRDLVLMMEVREEATHVPSHRQRTVLFLSAMRHYARWLGDRGVPVRYVTLDDPDNTHCFEAEIGRAVAELEPERVLYLRPGEWRVLEQIRSLEDDLDTAFETVEDDHFYLTPAEFDEWAQGRKELVLEHFYRMMRKRFDVLMTREGKPRGGEWNFDKENREPYRGNADDLPRPRRHRPDEITEEVIELVSRTFPDAPGELDRFEWSVTRKEALADLRDFIEHRLPSFGTYQDAMVTGQPWMYHSLLSPSLNLKLLNPRECVERAVEALHEGHAPVNCVEGFVRQLLGWREFIRGVYWREGASYAERNGLGEQGTLPQLYWTGDTDMNCLKESLAQVREHGYGHHIQRLMVTGNFALASGVHPREISDWYLAMYVDAVDWVTLPNTLGMIMHADGGIVGTKPYAAGGNYIKRMSDYCAGCKYDPSKRTGEDACPFSTFYWDFIARHEQRFRGNRRMSFAIRNLEKLGSAEIKRVRKRAAELRDELGMSNREEASG